MDGFSNPYRLDKNRNGGGILIYVREYIPSNKLLNKHSFPEDIEGIFLEINLRKQKWLLFGTYHPPSQNDEHFFNFVTRGLDIYSSSYDNFLLAGDFNAETTEHIMKDFLYRHDAKSLIKESTRFKNPLNTNCIDLFLTNKVNSFQNSIALSTGFSDFHKLIVTVLKTSFQKPKPN